MFRPQTAKMEHFKKIVNFFQPYVYKKLYLRCLNVFWMCLCMLLIVNGDAWQLSLQGLLVVSVAVKIKSDSGSFTLSLTLSAVNYFRKKFCLRCLTGFWVCLCRGLILKANVKLDHEIGLVEQSMQQSLLFCLIFFSIRLFFYDHSRISGLQGKGECVSLTPHYHFYPFQRHSGISRVIAAEGTHLCI